jgi:hypothetical protein
MDYFRQAIQYTDHQSLFHKLSEVRKLPIESPTDRLRDIKGIFLFALGCALDADGFELALLEDAA